ncbi:MAG: 23S rRNA pseudouridine(1911/1915/1917) synthase RluD [bacterium]
MADSELQAVVSSELAGQRLDKACAEVFPDFSRNQLKQWIESGDLQLDGEIRRPRDKVSAGQTLSLRPVLEDQVRCAPENIPLDLIYEDEQILVINKPAGLVVHPAAGNWQGTLQNALLYHYPNSIQLPRAGIVHRLDKETSGLMVVARTPGAHKRLVDALQARDIHREYRAITMGTVISGGTVDAPIGRHKVHRTRMAVTPTGKEAVTHYRVLEKFRAHTLLQVQLETGRTHQIRVHLADIHFPIAGDPVYGGRLRIPSGCSEALKQVLQQFKRQALHAFRLELTHPESGELMAWEAPMPDDMLHLLDVLRQDAAADGDT